jgi:hypothetical protein
MEWKGGNQGEIQHKESGGKKVSSPSEQIRKENKMKRFLVPMIIGAVLILTPFMAIGATFTGSIQGFQCVTQGKVCPIGQEDPMAAVENVFVLLVNAAAGEYYFVSNVDRAVLARHINEEVKIEGTVNTQMKDINANEIWAKGKKVWDNKMEEMLQSGYLGPGKGYR